MTISVAQQAAALAQAAALGLAVGLLYDLFRVLRVRVALPLLGAVLDLSFWIIVTVALFVWSQQAWRGEIRLYGIFFLFGGGVLYFWLISTWMLKIGYFLADAAALVWRILTLPLAAAGKLQKKTKKFAKNSFHFAQEWFKINQITEELDAAARRRERRETGGSAHAVQASRSFDQGRGDGPADLHGQIQTIQVEREELNQQVAAQQLENQQLANAIENSDDPDMLESVARDKGYVKSGETLYIDVAN
ncbi:spore cortex biosynthesis protein YabQ [Clostridium phoceensis]|uniref:spore cortex biosynthesis protein YabQ n=1 Tax=Clostridium phoceensis TaxID=1650661 RepID=UPI0023F892F8|nr:spore cortex biosynthesis protein YabQ [Clostridium phoceensis]